MNTFEKMQKIEEDTREIAMKNGLYDKYLISMINEDYPDHDVLYINHLEYAEENGIPTPEGQAQLDGIDAVGYLKHKISGKIIHINIQEKAHTAPCKKGAYGPLHLFELVNKNEKKGWGCDLNRVHYLINWFPDEIVAIRGLGKVHKLCNDLYNEWVKGGKQYVDDLTLNYGWVRNQKIKINKIDGPKPEHWTIYTYFTEHYILDRLVCSIRRSRIAL